MKYRVVEKRDVKHAIWNQQEAWQTFKSHDGRKVEEKVTVTDESVDIEVPNAMEVIYDYKHVCCKLAAKEKFLE